MLISKKKIKTLTSFLFVFVFLLVLLLPQTSVFAKVTTVSGPSGPPNDTLNIGPFNFSYTFKVAKDVGENDNDPVVFAFSVLIDDKPALVAGEDLKQVQILYPVFMTNPTIGNASKLPQPITITWKDFLPRNKDAKKYTWKLTDAYDSTKIYAQKSFTLKNTPSDSSGWYHIDKYKHTNEKSYFYVVSAKSSSKKDCETDKENTQKKYPGVVLGECVYYKERPDKPSDTLVPNTDTNYVLLQKLPDGSGGELTSFESDPTKNPCPFGKYFNILIKLFFGIAGVLAVVMIVMAGIQYMTSDFISSKEEAKNSITNVIFGLLLALGAWLILNTINPDLLNVCLNTMQENKAEITISPDYTAQTPINGKYCSKTNGTNGGYQNGADWKTIAGNPAKLPNGVKTNNGECSKVGDLSCTSLRGLDISKIELIKTKCPSCDIVVTAGTECWLHGGKNQSTSHRPGSSTIDIRATPSVNNFFAGTSDFPNDNKPYNKGGVSCKAESAGATTSTNAKHWHCGN